MREEVAAALASVATGMHTSAIAHGGGNVEYCRGVDDAIRAASIALRVWPDVQAQVDTGDAFLLLDEPHRAPDGNL